MTLFIFVLYFNEQKWDRVLPATFWQFTRGEANLFAPSASAVLGSVAGCIFRKRKPLPVKFSGSTRRMRAIAHSDNINFQFANQI